MTQNGYKFTPMNGAKNMPNGAKGMKGLMTSAQKSGGMVRSTKSFTQFSGTGAVPK